jgi:hypothetical protein
VLLNFIPSAVAGGAVYGALARWRRPTPSVTTAGSRHVVRTAPLYALAITLAIVLWDGFHNPRSGFGLVAQLVVWPLAAVVGGIIADAVVLGRWRRPSSSRISEYRPATAWRSSKAIAPANTVFASMTSGESVFDGGMAMPSRSQLLIITEDRADGRS